jgi:putative transposase
VGCLRDDYQLRFPIEFTFRDAKQYWGMEDFMVVNLSRRLMRDRRDTDPNRRVLDLTAHYRGLSYAEEEIKLLPEKPEPGLLRRILWCR